MCRRTVTTRKDDSRPNRSHSATPGTEERPRFRSSGHRVSPLTEGSTHRPTPHGASNVQSPASGAFRETTLPIEYRPDRQGKGYRTDRIGLDHLPGMIPPVPMPGIPPGTVVPPVL